MKKLMIAALAVAFAAVAQAATVSWNATKGALYNGNGSDSVKITSGDAYLMFVTSTFTQNNLVNAFASFEGDAGKTLEAMSSSGALATGAGSINPSNSRPTGESTYAMTTDQNVYFVVFANDKMFVSESVVAMYDSIGDAAEVSFTTSLAGSSKTTLDATAGYSNVGWYEAATVPEPTSGLLLLLGMAGLALKRKQA